VEERESVREGLDRKHREELWRFLQNPHPASFEIAGEVIEEWARSLPEEDAESLLDNAAGTAVWWIAGEGWVDDRA
jgi:hypothetical protein